MIIKKFVNKIKIYFSLCFLESAFTATKNIHQRFRSNTMKINNKVNFQDNLPIDEENESATDI